MRNRQHLRQGTPEIGAPRKFCVQRCRAKITLPNSMGWIRGRLPALVESLHAAWCTLPLTLLEAVANSPNGCNFVANIAELAAQTHNMRIDGTIAAIIRIAPDVVEQVAAAEAAPWVACEQQQQIILLAGSRGRGPSTHVG